MLRNGFDLREFFEIVRKTKKFDLFLELGRSHFDTGWHWLTTAAHNQKGLMMTKIAAIQGIASKRMAIKCKLNADTKAYVPFMRYDSSKLFSFLLNGL